MAWIYVGFGCVGVGLGGDILWLEMWLGGDEKIYEDIHLLFRRDRI